MKWLTFLLTASTATAATPLGLGASITQAEVTEQVRVVAKAPSSVNPISNMFGESKQLTFLEKEALRYEKERLRQQRLNNNRIKLKKVLNRLDNTVGKTWYVFSGSTPQGWDCSGLVRWTYKQVGVELEHRANAQANSGKKVKDPIPGDIIAFYRKGSSYSFHVGIYLGKGKMIHAYQHGMRTVIQPVKQVVKENWGARVTYTRILPQPEN
jgi:cell wall-associated NlpC family hydrolase